MKKSKCPCNIVIPIFGMIPNVCGLERMFAIAVIKQDFETMMPFGTLLTLRGVSRNLHSHLDIHDLLKLKMKKREEAEKQLVQTKKKILDAFQMSNKSSFDFSMIRSCFNRLKQLIKELIPNEYWANQTLNLGGSYRRDLLENSGLQKKKLYEPILLCQTNLKENGWSYVQHALEGNRGYMVVPRLRSCNI